jgi:hypothetical protein
MITTCRYSQIERFVRPLKIVNLSPKVEALLGMI